MDGLQVACVRCGKPGEEAVIAVDVNTGEIHCSECGETYTVEDVEAVVNGWLKLLPWIKACPALVRDPEPAGV